jgi:hypothetical protein
MAHEDVARFIDILSPILRLSVQTHDAIVAADSQVVLG